MTRIAPSLTTATAIPTSFRGIVRATVKAHPAWRGHCVSLGMQSADAKNADLIAFALMHQALANKVAGILGCAYPFPEVEMPAVTVTSIPAHDEALPEAFVEATKALHAAPISTPEPFMPTDLTIDSEDRPMANSFSIEGLLSGVDQFLAPVVKAELTKALTPVVAAANLPPVEVVREVERLVEVERIVEVAAGEAPKHVTNPARRGKRMAVKVLFPEGPRVNHGGAPWNDAQLTVWEGARSPAIDPFYVVDRQQMALLCTALERSTNVWLTGPASTGKSTMPEQACAHLGRPFVKLGMTRQTQVEDLVGGQGLVDGRTVWQDGALIRAMRSPGTVILIDELTIAPPGVQAVFQLVCDDHRSITLPTGETVRCADGVAFVVADNTAGSGDESGLYAGTNVSNAALVTRFKRMLHVGFLKVEQETAALVNHTACPKEAAKALAEFAAAVRKMPAMQGVVLSLRQMVGFVQVVQDGFTAKEAFATAISSRLPSTEKAALEALATLQWASEFDRLMQGKAASPVVTPSNSAAAKAFADENF